jgi:hypothetical protein
VLQDLAVSLKRRGLIVVISDLLDQPEEVAKGLKQLRSRGSDIMVFQVLDQDELKFPFKEPSVFQDMEEDLKLLTDPHAIRAAYLDAIHGLIKHYRESCAAYLIDYSLFDTSVGLDRALVRYLSWRQRLKPLLRNA